MNSQHSLPDACAVLISHPDAVALFKTLQDVARLPANLPIELSGDSAVLNPLLALYRADRKGFDATLMLIENKRELKGRPPLAQPNAPEKFDKDEYQRVFMDQKRVRERRAAEIENDPRPAKDRLRGNARIEFMRQQSARWKVRRDQVINAARAACGGTLDQEHYNTILEQFWAGINDELTEMEEENRRALRK